MLLNKERNFRYISRKDAIKNPKQNMNSLIRVVIFSELGEIKNTLLLL